MCALFSCFFLLSPINVLVALSLSGSWQEGQRALLFVIFPLRSFRCSLVPAGASSLTSCISVVLSVLSDPCLPPGRIGAVLNGHGDVYTICPGSQLLKFTANIRKSHQEQRCYSAFSASKAHAACDQSLTLREPSYQNKHNCFLPS